MLRGNLIILGHHFFSPMFILDDIFYIGHHFTGQGAVHLHHIQPQGFDVILKHLIAVDQHRLLKIKRLNQGIAEPFI